MTYRVILPALLFFLALILGCGYYINALWHQVITLEESPTVVTIYSGESLHQVLSRAEAQGWLTDAGWVGRLARWQGLDQKIQVGEFRLNAGITVGQMIEHLATGQAVQYQVTIPEGVTTQAAIALLGKHPKLTKTSPEKLSAELTAWVLPAHSVEGWFLPETWSFVAGDTDKDILQ